MDRDGIMGTFRDILDSFDTITLSVQNSLGLAVRGLLILEIIWVGYHIMFGKGGSGREIAWKTLSVIALLFVGTYLRPISNEILHGLIDVANIAVSGAMNTANYIDYNDPLSSGVETISNLWKSILDVASNLFNKELQVDGINNGMEFENPNVNVFSLLGKEFVFPSISTVIAWLLYIIFGLFFMLLIVYTYCIYYVQMLIYNVVLVMGVVLIIFQLWQPTKWISDKVFSAILANILMIFTFNLIMGIALYIISMTILGDSGMRMLLNEDGVINMAGLGSMIVTMLIVGITIYLLIKRAPEIGNGFITGTAPTAGLNLGTFMAQAVGAGTAVGGLGLMAAKAGANIAGNARQGYAEGKTMSGSKWEGVKSGLLAGADSVKSHLKNAPAATGMMIAAAAGAGHNGVFSTASNVAGMVGRTGGYKAGLAQGSEHHMNRTHNQDGSLNQTGERLGQMNVMNNVMNESQKSQAPHAPEEKKV